MMYSRVVSASFLGFFCAATVCAEISDLTHPYVEPLEREIEMQTVHSRDNLDRYQQSYSLAYGQAIEPQLFLEVGVSGERDRDNSLREEEYELELLWQLSEQGEYWMDYAVEFEAAREVHENVSEVGASLVLEKELLRTSLAVNMGLAYEFGSGIDNEYDRFLMAQWRYRRGPGFQPAIELHMDEYDKAAGPGAMGLWRLGNRSKLKWSAALLFALDDETPSSLFRTAIEYEF